MRKFVSKTLNVKRLLALGDLDIRKMAEQNEMLSAAEYFGRVELFLEHAPEYGALLSQATDIKELRKLKNILTSIGYSGLNADINRICHALKDGEQAQAKKWAGEARNRFNWLYDRTNTACLPKKKFHATSAFGSGKMPEEDVISLCDALDYFDYEEANRKLRVLVVDDIAVVLHTITAALGKYYEVFALTKSSQVEEFLTHTTPELFLLDIEMPDMHGYDLVPVIRQFEQHKDTPIIFLTGNASMENLKTAISLGACDFIAKPINQEVLLEKIQSKIVRKKSF